MTTTDFAKSSAQKARPTMTKSRRVRTGCLTCRQRHLKCDEAMPDCLYCRKSNRQCKRGVRLNFLDVVVHVPACRPPANGWAIEFQDESRQVASEYRGGLKRYTQVDEHVASRTGVEVEVALKHQNEGSGDLGWHHGSATRQFKKALLKEPFGIGAPAKAADTFNIVESRLDSHAASLSHMLQTQVIQGGGLFPPLLPSPLRRPPTFQLFPWSEDSPAHKATEKPLRILQPTSLDSHVDSTQGTSTTVPRQSRQRGKEETRVEICVDLLPVEDSNASGEREFLRSPEELRYMRVFVEEVGVWMDSFDPDNHFGQLIPYQALKSPILLNSFLACGVKHLALACPDQEEQALFYYNTATTQLLRNLQNPDRNTAECATAAVILNVYEVMSEKPAQHMNHIAGARALIRDCGWNAGSTGTGLACFWLNIALEVLSCLAMSCSTTWDPDDWGLDTTWAKNRGQAGEGGDNMAQDEAWVHRIFYVVAKIANFRASVPLFLDDSPHEEQMKLGSRLIEWQELKGLCDGWNKACPRTMHPIGYMDPEEATGEASLFPKVWLIKREAILGRLLYHTAQCLLTQTNPVEPAKMSEEMHALQLHHAHQVCGIAAQAEDGAVSAVAIRSLALVSCVLSEHCEQMEVLDILGRIHLRRGWYLGTVEQELKAAWQWNNEKLVRRPTGGCWDGNRAGSSSQGPPPSGPEHRVNGRGRGRGRLAPQGALGQAPEPLEAAVGGALNPLGSADFSLPNRPYQNWYERPSRGESWGPPF